MINIADVEIGNGKTMLITELSANHGHNIEIAKETIRAAKRPVADAIKFRTYATDTLTIDCDNPDFLMDEEKFKQLVFSVRDVEKVLGRISYKTPEKIKSDKKFARSLCIVGNMKNGDVLTEEKIRSIQPEYGLLSKYLKDVLDKVVKKDLLVADPFHLDYI